MAIFFYSGSLTSQNGEKLPFTSQSNWQQKVDHQIAATLDTDLRTLRCQESISYTNNSPDELKVIRMHIWPNAFSTKNKAYGKEARITGNNTFLQAKKSDLGFLDSLKFEVNGKPTTYVYLNDEPDIIEVALPEPLKSGETIAIYTPFRVKLPFLFSRIGYSGSLLSVTQWYPKPAVYDVNGWNTFSYQDQGEYYSEFGKYTVDLVLPEDYIVGATGVLQNEDEINWLSDLTEKTAEKRDNKKNKKLTFIQDSVSDFAWFADPKFKVGESTVTLPNGRKIHTYAMVNGGKYSPDYVLGSIETALKYYSKRVGNYPYDFCTAVIGKLTSAGGMEYPMITICGDASEGTIIHEVGHNWFQGILGSQERNYPWMDESVNTFYQNQAELKGNKDWKIGDRINPADEYGAFRMAYDLGVIQTGTLHSEKYQQTNYGSIVYSANPMRFAYLQEYLGKSMMDSCMKKYFENWKYKHPLPSDFQFVFEQVSGQNLNWFFKDLMGGTTPDVSIGSVSRTLDGHKVKIRNFGKYSLPVKLKWETDSGTQFRWILAADTEVFIPKATFVSINPSAKLPEGNLANNDARTKGIFKTTGKLKIGLPDLYHRGWNKIWILPNFFTGNRYDGYTPGIIVSNLTFPRRKWEWWAAPSWGLKSGEVVGNLGLQRNLWFQNGPFAMAELRTTGKTYTYMPDSARTLQRYLHWSNSAEVFFKRKKAWVQHSLKVEFIANTTYSAFLFRTGWGGGAFNKFNGDRNNELIKLSATRRSYKKTVPTTLYMAAEYGSNFQPSSDVLWLGLLSQFKFLKAQCKLDAFVPYHFFRSKNSGLTLTAYAIGFLWQQNSHSTGGVYNPIVSGANGNNDYAFQEALTGRSEAFGSGNRLGHQLLSNMPGIRMLPNIFANNFVTGINLSSNFIPKVPLKLFADAGLGDVNGNADLYWTSGVCLQTLFGNKITSEINMPLIYSSNFNTAVTGVKWYQLWSFKLNIPIFSLFSLAREVYK